MIHEKGRVWTCEYCGKSTVVSSSEETGVVTCKLKIVHDSVDKEIEMTDRCVIKVGYRKRATLADRFPMILEVKTTDESVVVESIENIGKGTIFLDYDISQVKVTVEGEISVKFTGPIEHNRYLDSGASIILGSAIITII